MSVVAEHDVRSAGSPLPPVEPLHVTACGVVSAAGIGLDALAAALGGAAPHAEPVTGDVEGYPPRPVRSVPPFDAVALLGRKGTRNLDRLTRLGLIASNEAVGALPGGLPADRGRTGVVVGTTTGSITTTTDVGRDTFVSEKPYMVNPATFPNTVMNTCGGQIAIRNGLLGVNAALSGGKVSGLLAVRYARTALSQHRADRLVVGAVEEVTDRTAWAWHRTGVLGPETPLGEGAAVVIVERAGPREPLAELLGCEVGYFGGSRPGPAAGLARCVATALHRSGLSAADVDVVAPGSTGHVLLAGVERRALRTAVGTDVEVVDVTSLLGECYSAGTSLQLAALLAGPRRGRPRIGLVTSVGDDGNVGALLVRLP